MKTSIKTIASLLILASAITAVAPGCAGTSTRQSTGEYIDDTTVTAKVKSALVSDDSVRARDVQVETFRGIVQLSGFVDSDVQKQRAETLAAGVSGVSSVKNNIVVKAQ